MQQQQATTGSSTTTTTTTTTAAPTTTTVLVNGVAVLVPLPEVMELLRAADKISTDTVYGGIKKAAAIAQAAMAANLGPIAKVEQVMAIYAPLWLEITDDNVKRDFRNLLWIYADPKAQVTVPVPVPSATAPITQIVDAIKVITGNMSKSVITGVSKQIRDIHDAGRAPGAGRPKKVVAPSLPANPLPNTGTALSPALGAQLMSMLPGGIPAPSTPAAPAASTPAAPTPQPSLNPAVSTGTLPAGSTNPKSPAATLPAPSVAPAAQPAKVQQAGPTFYEELELRLSNPGDAAKVHAAVERRGYKVSKAQNVTPAKTETTKDATALLAEKLLETTPETAIMQAASKAAALKIAKEAKAKTAVTK